MKLLRRAAFTAVSFLIANQISAAELCREISVSYTSGNIDGHLQAPSGGPLSVFGPPRHLYSELGIDDFHQYNFEGRYDYRQNRFYLNYDRTRIDEDVVLTQGILIDGELSFVWTTPMDFSNRLDLYRLGYQRLFDTQLFGQKLTLAPGAELALLDFEYRLKNELFYIAETDEPPIFDQDISFGDYLDLINGISEPSFVLPVPNEIDRSYTKTGLRIGGEAEYWLSERFSLTAELYDSIPVEDWPEIFTAKLGLRVKLFEGDHTAVYLHGSLGRETLEYEDEDSFSDNIRAEYRDMLEGGISVRF